MREDEGEAVYQNRGKIAVGAGEDQARLGEIGSMHTKSYPFPKSDTSTWSDVDMSCTIADAVDYPMARVALSLCRPPACKIPVQDVVWLTLTLLHQHRRGLDKIGLPTCMCGVIHLDVHQFSRSASVENLITLFQNLLTVLQL